MSVIADSYDPVRTNGDGVQVAFPFNFAVLATADVVVSVVPDATNIPALQVEGVDYTVALNTITEGGVVTMTVAPASIEDLLMERNVAIDQPVVIPNVGAIKEEQIEVPLDRGALVSQQIDEVQRRTVKQSVTDSTLSPAFNTDLPAIPTDSKRHALVNSTDGTKFEFSDTDLDDLESEIAAAAASAAAAAASETNAATSETNAATSETNAAISAAAALVSELAAAQSALDAANATEDQETFEFEAGTFTYTTTQTPTTTFTTAFAKPPLVFARIRGGISNITFPRVKQVTTTGFELRSLTGGSGTVDYFACSAGSWRLPDGVYISAHTSVPAEFGTGSPNIISGAYVTERKQVIIAGDYQIGETASGDIAGGLFGRFWGAAIDDLSDIGCSAIGMQHNPANRSIGTQALFIEPTSDLFLDIGGPPTSTGTGLIDTLKYEAAIVRQPDAASETFTFFSSFTGTPVVLIAGETTTASSVKLGGASSPSTTSVTAVNSGTTVSHCYNLLAVEAGHVSVPSSLRIA